MQDTSISWSDISWNPVRGCSRISAGCTNCYAEALAARHSVVSEKRPDPPFEDFAEFRIVGGKREAHWTGKVELIESKLLEPLSWRKKALKFHAEHGRKPRTFISMSDLFHEDLPDEALDRVFAVMALTPEINYMILTKRAERMARYLEFNPNKTFHNCSDLYARILRWADPLRRTNPHWPNIPISDPIKFPMRHIALGVSVESQKYADERIPHLLRTPAAMRFVSYEPALDAVDWGRCYRDHADGLCDHETSGLDMIIVGGESGPGARPFDSAWARSTVKQCREAGVAPFVKQMGSNMNGDWPEFPNWDWDANGYPIRNRKGEDMAEWPEDLRVREWPEGWG